MSTRDDQILAALMREDFYTFMKVCFMKLHPHAAFLDNWHLHVMAAELEAVALGRTPRLILNLPPRSLKSVAASVALVAWFLGRYPSADVVCASYGKKLAEEFALDCRRVMTSRWYAAVFDTRLISPRSAVADFKTVQGGSRLATSVDGQLTGRGGDLIVIDDPIKPDEALSDVTREATNRWFRSTVHSRSNNRNEPRIAVVMQRLHRDDLSGYLLRQSPPWRHVRLTAIAEQDETFTIRVLGKERTYTRKEGDALHPARESLQSLMDTRETIGPAYFAAQYQQTPTAPDGNVVKIPWFARYDLPPVKFDRIFQSWDTASTMNELSSYSVCTTWGVLGKNVYLLHVFRKRLEYPDLKRAVLDQAQIHGATTVLIEEKSSGIALIQDLSRDGFYSATAIQPERDKEMRMVSQTGIIENGFVYLPKEAPWLADYEQEMAEFPQSRHSDQVDSTSQALQWFRDLGKNTGLLEYYRMEVEQMRRDGRLPPE